MNLMLTNIKIFPIIRTFSSTKTSNIIEQCFSNPSIVKRVQAFKQTTLFDEQLRIEKYKIKIPEQFKLTNAKSVGQFHRTNKTKANLVILHSLAYIQLNAFLAYADTFFRFGLSQEHQSLRKCMGNDEILKFREQIKRIALDQGQHCLLLASRLEQLGYKFGDFPVISNLTNTLHQTTDNILERLALISIVHEGRGMKSIDKLIKKVYSCQDKQSALILKKIQSQQKFHFESGLKWFKYFTQKQYNRQKSTSHPAQAESLSLQKYTQKILNKINEKYKKNIELKQLQLQDTGLSKPAQQI